MTDEAQLKAFGCTIGKLIRREDLSRPDAKEAFRQVLMDEQPELQQGAFLAALAAKGETPEEIAGSWDAIYEFDTVHVKPATSAPLFENCGTGMDRVKTFNISTASAVVAAAAGVCMAKHGARAITSTCGAVDVAEALGVAVECPAEVVTRSIERAGIGLFNGMSRHVHPRALHRILAQIRFGSTLNIAASLANPAMPRHALRGVYSSRMVGPAAEVMREIGYERALVVFGRDDSGDQGMDEWSVLGETEVAEISPGGRIQRYVVAPEDLGVPRAEYEPLRPAANVHEEAARFVALLSGHDDTARTDAVCLNAGPILWLMGKAKDLRTGVEQAKGILADGRARAKLEEWVVTQTTDANASEAKLASAARRASH